MKSRSNIHVLVAEDDYLVREMIQGLLEELGYVVVGEASCGWEAVELVHSLEPHIVLMDVKMAGLSGIEAARHIQERHPTPVVILTAFESSELVEQASRVGVGAYLIKPPNARELERAITIALARFEDMQELRALNEDLRARNEELDAFAYTVAHDLKNPLANIIGFAEVLTKHCATMPVEEVQTHLSTVGRIGRKMNGTIEQLLLLARMRHEEVERQPLDMAHIVAEAQQRLEPVIEEQQAQIILPDTWPVAWGHAPWVEEVWFNYLSNAIKYGRKPPQVELGAEVQPDGAICFWIRDNGLGVRPEDRRRLFVPFSRLGGTRHKGYGLGLAIVRRIVEKLGGQVGVESEEGEGAVFFFTLPGVDGR
jgi:signal transduction histidine kinase